MRYIYQVKTFSLILLFVSFVIPIIQYHIELLGYCGISAVFINDTQSYWENIISFHDGIEGNYYTLIGVIILYYPAFYFSWIYCYLVNYILLVFSSVLFVKSIYLLKLNRSNDYYISIFLIVIFNFYLWGILFFPNKEIPLIFLTNLFLYSIISKKSKSITLFIIFITFFFRDGFAFILFSAIMLNWILGKKIVNNPIKSFLSIIFILMFFSLKTLSKLGLLSDYQYVVDRNIAYESESSFAYELPYFISYLINIFNNSIVYAFRAQFFDLNNRVYFHGVGLWQFAVILTLGLISWVKLLINYKYKESMLFNVGLIIIVSYLLLSTSSYPQVRYMMPFCFWLTAGVLLSIDLKSLIFVFTIIFLLALAVIFFGFSHKPGLGIDIDNFSKSLFSH
jgi:hypothetical protein